MWPNPQFPADLVTFTEEIMNGKLHLLCSVSLSAFKDFDRFLEKVIENCLLQASNIPT